MERFFAIDGNFFRFMSRMADLMVLNLLWILCSIPIITVGAATAALCKITLEMAENRESYVVRTFLRAYMVYMKRATAGWLAFLTCQAVLAAVFAAGKRSLGEERGALVTGIMVCEILLMMLFLYIVPLITNKINGKYIVRLAALLAVGNLPWSVLLLAGEGIILYLAVRYTVLAAPVLLVIGVSGISYLTSRIYLYIFRKCGIGRV